MQERIPAGQLCILRKGLVSRRWAREAREAAEAQEHKLEPSSEGAADVPGVLLEGAADTFR